MSLVLFRGKTIYPKSAFCVPSGKPIRADNKDDGGCWETRCKGVYSIYRNLVLSIFLQLSIHGKTYLLKLGDALDIRRSEKVSPYLSNTTSNTGIFSHPSNVCNARKVRLERMVCTQERHWKSANIRRKQHLADVPPLCTVHVFMPNLMDKEHTKGLLNRFWGFFFFGFIASLSVTH